MTIRVDFCGAGGTMQGIRQAGYTGRVVGIEFNAAAAATARAAGHEVIEGDVRDVPADAFGPLLGYSAGPPCQTFSAAGKGSGRVALQHLISAALKVANGATPADAVAAQACGDLDERSILALHPLAVIRDARPAFVMLEQVKEVRPLWEAYAGILRGMGYLVAVHVWSAETYGAPQTRKRASLVAVHSAALMGLKAFLIEEADLIAPPTHSRYYPRNKAKRDEGVLPFVTIAEALGRCETLRSNYGTGGDARKRGVRQPDEPAPTVTSKVDRNKWLFAGAGATSQFTAGQVPRLVEEAPAHTITGKATAAWVPAISVVDGGEVVMGDVRSSRGTVRSLDEPAPTLTGAMGNGNYRWQPTVAVEGDTSWVNDRPSPTIVGSFRPDIVAAPGYRKAGDPPRQKTPGSVQVSVREAACLQTFPADYPWQGTQTQQYQQIGNAEPPIVAQAIASHLLNLIGV